MMGLAAEFRGVRLWICYLVLISNLPEGPADVCGEEAVDDGVSCRVQRS